MAKIIEGLYYSESHEFVKVEGEYAYIGITDFAQGQLGNVTYIEFPEIDDEISAGDSFGSVESVKAASDLTSPVSGVVVELISKDAYSNWLIKIKLSDPSELESLMDAQAYTNICK